jgi:hypothetical protein
MAKKIYYDEGFAYMTAADIRFNVGEPKEVPDDIAEALVRKGRFKFWEEKLPTEKEG